jgi:hypothetical protein
MKYILIILSLLSFTCFAQENVYDQYYGTATGTNSYSVTITPVVISTPYNAQKLVVKFNNANTGASTLKVNSYATKAITMNGSALASGDITANVYYLLIYNTSGGGSWQMIKSGTGGGGGSYWSLTGDSGTSFPANFIGTTDAQPFVLKTNDTTRMTFDTLGNIEALNGHIYETVRYGFLDYPSQIGDIPSPVGSENIIKNCFVNGSDFSYLIDTTTGANASVGNTVGNIHIDNTSLGLYQSQNNYINSVNVSNMSVISVSSSNDTVQGCTVTNGSGFLINVTNSKASYCSAKNTFHGTFSVQSDSCEYLSCIVNNESSISYGDNNTYIDNCIAENGGVLSYQSDGNTISNCKIINDGRFLENTSSSSINNCISSNNSRLIYQGINSTVSNCSVSDSSLLMSGGLGTYVSGVSMSGGGINGAGIENPIGGIITGSSIHNNSRLSRNDNGAIITNCSSENGSVFSVNTINSNISNSTALSGSVMAIGCTNKTVISSVTLAGATMSDNANPKDTINYSIAIGLGAISNSTNSFTWANGTAVTGSDSTATFGGKVKIIDGTQGLNKVLTSDANGLASWQSMDSIFTPVMIDSTNVDATNINDAMAIIAGRLVTAQYSIFVTPNTTLTPTQIKISLPIAANPSATPAGQGVFEDTGGNAAAIVKAVDANTISVDWTPVSTSSQLLNFSVTYRRQ